MRRSHFLAALKPRISSEFARFEEETTDIELGDDPADLVQPGGPICVNAFSNDRLLVIADALAKSTVLAHDERRVAAVFDVIEPFARELAERGRTPRDRKAMLKLIGNALLVQQRVSGRVAVVEKPRRALGQARARTALCAAGGRVRAARARRRAGSQADGHRRNRPGADRHDRYPAFAAAGVGDRSADRVRDRPDGVSDPGAFRRPLSPAENGLLAALELSSDRIGTELQLCFDAFSNT